jgi:hypothetical protein
VQHREPHAPRQGGFFAPERWEKGNAVKHEISLNPSHLRSRKPIEVASTLVHEMVHLFDERFEVAS